MIVVKNKFPAEKPHQKIPPQKPGPDETILGFFQ